MTDNPTFQTLHFAVLTVSDTRALETDKSGNVLVEVITASGHLVLDRKMVKDDKNLIVENLKHWIDDAKIDVVITTGGTGLTGRDVTPEAFAEVVEKPIPGFGELFRWLSFQKIGPSTVQSRATAGIANGTFLFALPGSPSACRDAWEMILQHQFNRQSRPCNFVELIPRLKEI